MLWLLQKLNAWMNRPYNFEPELADLRRRQAAMKNEEKGLDN